MKKYLSFCLILAMLVSLVACGGTAPEQTQPEETVPGEHVITDAGTVTVANGGNSRVFYHIFVGSFSDSNNDGIGDLRGIIDRMDYINDGDDNSGVSLGVEGIWLSPIFLSPSYHKYDVTDYYQIDPKFGTMEDLKELIELCHSRNVQIILDLVINHSSRGNKWFQNFVNAHRNNDPTDPYYDFYAWADEKLPGATYYPITGTDRYYEGNFSSEMPEMNFDNETVRQAMVDLAKFYLDMGVDGFRCDVINLISKDQRFKNGHNPLILVGKKYFINGPRLHEFLHEINKDVLSHYDCMTVGETTFCNLDDMKKMTADERQELSMVFNFDHTSVDNFLGVKWLMRKFKLTRFKKTLDKYQYGLSDIGWNSLFYENHDQRRSVGRFNTCDKEYRVESAKMLATTMYFLKGTPFIYQGQEIGMTNYDVDSIHDFIDIENGIAVYFGCGTSGINALVHPDMRNLIHEALETE